LIAAVGSFLDARAHGGVWLVRIEDLDPPRERPGSADSILRTLEALGLYWDGPVVRQSTRGAAYAAALDELSRLDLVRACRCSRSALAALPQNLGRPSGDDLFHPARCVLEGPEAAPGHALRLRVPDQEVEFNDRAQGKLSTNVARACGDFILQRRDGLYAYQLAVVVDDAWQGITDVVRGADLLTSTPRQILLQRALGHPTPAYLHLPLAVDDKGRKLSKSEDATAAGQGAPGAAICAALDFLRQQPPRELADANAEEALSWGMAHWRPAAFAGTSERLVQGCS
jgi:glutamyl-Q tRNA(Asp) synthetase